MARPKWWDWNLVLTPHVEKRMEDRGFSEIDLWTMTQLARRHRRDRVPGRWVLETRLRGRDWEVVVEPEARARRLVVVTAYPVGE